jgi:hypothetical protein
VVDVPAIEEEVKFTEFNFTSITEYGWEDTSKDTAKVYLLKGLEGIKSHDPSMIQCDFESMTIDLKIRGFKGKNLRFRIDPVFDVLAVEACSVNIKTNSISLTLKKQNPKKWTSLKWVKPMGKQEPEPDLPKKNEDAENGDLMSLMKDLY